MNKEHVAQEMITLDGHQYIIVASFSGPMNITRVTLSGKKLKMLTKSWAWVFDFKFPFIHRKEHSMWHVTML